MTTTIYVVFIDGEAVHAYSDFQDALEYCIGFVKEYFTLDKVGLDYAIQNLEWCWSYGRIHIEKVDFN